MNNKVKNTKKQVGTSIRVLILVPVIILGIVGIFSNALAMKNIRSVNAKATQITDEYMESMISLNAIQKELQSIHQNALSHIIATDFDTMINLVNTIKSQETDLEQKMDEFGEVVDADDMDSYKDLMTNYENFKAAVTNVVAYSANTKTADAYACANGDLSNYSAAMISDLDKITQHTSENSEETRAHLATVYRSSIVSNVLTIVISIIAVLSAVASVLTLVIRPIKHTEKEITDIISDIEKRQGDLTKRVKIASVVEIGSLGHGINAFMEKLQHIFAVLSNDSEKMDSVVNEVMESVQTSNDSASDLSALTEELSATMEEVSSNASLINNNADNVKNEVSIIADKSAELSRFSQEMMQHADHMQSSAKDNMQTTSAKINEILEILNQAIEESKSVDQVNSLTNDILNISSQTNLLSLNASIEAARAGEAGKGFAVVAGEISQLAESSRQTANRIQEINTVVTNAVHNLAEHAQGLVSYMNESIVPELESFVDSGTQYRENASYIETTMKQFEQQTDELKRGAVEIAESINSITNAIEEGVKGVNGVAESTQMLVTDMEKISKRMEENQQISSELQNETSIFTRI